MRRRPRVGPRAVAVAVLLGCGDDLGPRVPATIAVTPAAPQVPLAGTLQLEATVVDASGREIPGHSVSFESSDTAVLTVTGGGLLTSTGDTGISLISMASGDLTATVEAEVVLPPSALVVRPRSLELNTDEQQGLRFTVTERNGKPLPAAEVTFRTSDLVVPRSLRMAAGDYVRLYIIVTDEHGDSIPDAHLVLETDNAAVASVSVSGEVRAGRSGLATVYVTSGEHWVDIPVTVTP